LRTVRPGMNFSVAGFGVASVWMNMAPLAKRLSFFDYLTREVPLSSRITS
jgi:hypothetical protein